MMQLLNELNHIKLDERKEYFHIEPTKDGKWVVFHSTHESSDLGGQELETFKSEKDAKAFVKKQKEKSQE